MRDLGRSFFVGCFLLGATVSALGVASPGISDVSNPEVVETTTPAPLDRPMVQSRQPQVPSGNPLWGIPIEQLSTTRDRPIFSPSRRPPPPAIAGPPVAVVPTVQKPREPDRPQLMLVGTIVNGDDGFGIFMDQATKIPLRIRIGAAYQGWTLRFLQQRSATLIRGQESAVLAFPKPASDERPGAGPLVAAPAARPPSLPPRLGLTGQAPARNPPAESTSFRVPARPFGNPALRQ